MRKNIWLWVFYDFANSFAYITVSFYFALWFVSDHGASNAWISLAVAIATIILLFTLPAFGVVSDRTGKRMPFLIVFSLLTFISLAALGVTALAISSFTPMILALVIILYFLFHYFYQASL